MLATPTWTQLRHIDQDRAWKVLCRLDREGLLILMARALKVMPVDALESIFSGYAHPHELVPRHSGFDRLGSQGREQVGG